MQRVWLILSLAIGPATSAWADGCYIPERATRKIPEITGQRALICWKDGIETLIVSSALDAESQRLGWSIPLPAVPDTLEKQSPGPLKTLSFCVQPRITHDLHDELSSVTQMVILGNLLLGVFLFKRKRFVDLLTIVLVIAMLRALLLPALGGLSSSPRARANVSVEKSATVGSYEVQVVKAAQPGDLNGWLNENGFANLPANGDEIVADYISRGWVFAAIKLTREEAGANTPHPLKLVFASQKALYPMRLTSLAGGSPEFEVFVVAPQRANCNMLPVEFCDRFTKQLEGQVAEAEPTTELAGMTTTCTIDHPALQELLWDQCVLTKLAGRISAAEMRADMEFEWASFQSQQQHFFTSKGATYTVLIVCIALGGAWLFLTMIACRQAIRQPGGAKRYLLKILLPAFVVLGTGVAVWRAHVSTLKGQDIVTSRSARWFPGTLRSNIRWLLDENPKVLLRSDREIAAFILQNVPEVRELKTPLTNELTGDPVVVEDSPGNFLVEKTSDQVVVRVYETTGRALTTTHQIKARSGQ